MAGFLIDRASHPPSRRVSVWDRVAGYFTGADVFISYSRADAFDYAGRLAELLHERGLQPFLDQVGSPPGREVPPNVLAAARRASVLVLIGSPAALASPAVALEVAGFPAHRRPIIAVQFPGADLSDPAHEPWVHSLEGIAVTRETEANVAGLDPSDELLARIAMAVSNRGQISRLRRVGIAAALVLVMAAAALVWIGLRLSTSASALQTSRADLSALDARRDALAKQVAGLDQRVIEATAAADSASARAAAQGDATDYAWRLLDAAQDLLQADLAKRFSCADGKLAVSDIYFATDRDTLPQGALDGLRVFADCYRRLAPSARIELEGYASDFVVVDTPELKKAPAQFREEDSLAIADKRAQLVKDALVNFGILADHVHTVSYGNLRTWNAEGQKALNNRVAIVVVR